MNRQNLTLAAALSCGACLFLLGGESQRQVVAIPEVNVESEKPVNAELPEMPNTDDEPSDMQQTIEPVANKESLAIEFELPYPDRVTLFQAPKRQGKGLVKSNGQSETEVELLGFVNVGSQRVVLSIDGLVAPIAEGGKEHGIEVISIQPPTVILQRGRQRWQASLGN